jgi:hypothetical protein
VLLPVGRVGCCARHDDLHFAFIVVIVVKSRIQLYLNLASGEKKS